MKIVALVGSLRQESFNKKLAHLAQEVVTDRHPNVEFEILDWSAVPLLNQDIEFPTPKPVAELRERIKEADGLWIFSPEYNHSFPGAFKNTLDWLSRPVNENEKQVLIGKPTAISGVSIGMSGTSHVQDHYLGMLSFLQVDIMSYPRLLVPYISDDNMEERFQESLKYLKREADAFVEYISK